MVESENQLREGIELVSNSTCPNCYTKFKIEVPASKSDLKYGDLRTKRYGVKCPKCDFDLKELITRAEKLK